MDTILTVVLAAAMAAVVVYTVLSYRKKLREGCCGGSGDRIVRTAAAKSGSFPCAAVAEVEGMMCQNCAARIENAVNAEADLQGKVNLARKQLAVRGAAPVEEARIRQIVARAGYRVTSFH